jgi:hypothetical protein
MHAIKQSEISLKGNMMTSTNKSLSLNSQPLLGTSRRGALNKIGGGMGSAVVLSSVGTISALASSSSQAQETRYPYTTTTTPGGTYVWGVQRSYTVIDNLTYEFLNEEFYTWQSGAVYACGGYKKVSRYKTLPAGQSQLVSQVWTLNRKAIAKDGGFKLYNGRNMLMVTITAEDIAAGGSGCRRRLTPAPLPGFEETWATRVSFTAVEAGRRVYRDRTTGAPIAYQFLVRSGGTDQGIEHTRVLYPSIQTDNTAINRLNSLLDAYSVAVNRFNTTAAVVAIGAGSAAVAIASGIALARDSSNNLTGAATVGFAALLQAGAQAYQAWVEAIVALRGFRECADGYDLSALHDTYDC